MIILYLRNPDDGVSTYDQVKVYRSSSQNGTYALLNTMSIDQTTIADGVPGYTQVTDADGTVDNWYKFLYYNSVSTLTSNYSESFQGGTTELDAKIRRRMKDTNVNKYYFDNDEIGDARDLAIQSLYPHTWIDTTHDVVISDSNKTGITLPQYIARVDTIKIYDSESNLIGNNYLGFYKVGNKLYPQTEFPTGYTFRIIYTKAYTQPAECPEHFTPYLLDIAQIELLKVMETGRMRYYKYTSSVRPEGGNIPSLNRIIERLEKSAARKLNSIRRVRETTEINLVG